MNSGDLDQVNIMNHVFTKETQVCLNITLKQHEEGMKEVSKRARIEVINNLDKGSREKLKRQDVGSVYKTKESASSSSHRPQDSLVETSTSTSHLAFSQSRFAKKRQQ